MAIGPDRDDVATSGGDASAAAAGRGAERSPAGRELGPDMARNVAHSGLGAGAAIGEIDRLDRAREAGRSTVSTRDIEARLPDIRTMIHANYVTSEIMDRLPPDARAAAEAMVEAEMVKMGRKPDETGPQRDERVAQEQQQLQQGMGAVIGGAGLLGALDNMTGAGQPKEAAGQAEASPAASNPFAALLAGVGPLNLGMSSRDMGSYGAADNNLGIIPGLGVGPQQRQSGAALGLG